MSSWEPPLMEAQDPEHQRIRRFMRLCAWGGGVAGGVLIFLGEDHVGAGYLVAAGTAVLWSGSIFLPLLVLNRDLLKLASARLIVLGLVALQFMAMAAGLKYVQALTIIGMFPLCVLELMLFELPFLWLRRQLGQK